MEQTTGNVYVFAGRSAAGAKTVVVYPADGGDGEEEITRFGEIAPEGEQVAASPAKIHQSPYPGALEVTGEGEVFVFDNTLLGSFYHRLMVFRPESPGDFENYVYAGEVLAGEGFDLPTAPVADEAGNLYVGGGRGGETIKMFAPEAPAAFPAPPPGPPDCEFSYAQGGITAVTVNPETGEPFFFSYKKPKVIHRLSACEGANSKKWGRSRWRPNAMTCGRWRLTRRVNSTRGGRGALYAGAPGPEPLTGVGKGEPGQSSLGYIFASPIEAPPVVEAESVTKVKTTSAVLRAKIDPKGFKAHFAFEYLSEAEYQDAGESFAGAAEAPVGGADIEGTGAQNVAVTITGLIPDTAYRFRAVAASNCKPSEQSVPCETEGVGASFHTAAPQGLVLPDGRAWELVSPARRKAGRCCRRTRGSAPGRGCKPGRTYQYFPMQSSPDGNGVAYEGTAFGTGAGAAVENQYTRWPHRCGLGERRTRPHRCCSAPAEAATRSRSQATSGRR